jgi:hypothetical protein
MTRAWKNLAAQFQEQQDSDHTIAEVLAHFPTEDSDHFPDDTAPELQHTCESLGTTNTAVWERVLKEQSWKFVTLLPPSLGLGATHPGLEVPHVPNTQAPFGLADNTYYREWNTTRGGWAVLVPNWFLSEYSFHTGDTPLWTQGDVVGKFKDPNGKDMVVVNLGGYNTSKHMASDCVRFAIGPNDGAIGSEGRHGYGWKKRQYCFSPKAPIRGLRGEDGDDNSADDTPP